MGYTSFSPEVFAEERSRVDAMMMLPLLSGSAPQLARQFVDRQVSKAWIDSVTIGVVIGCLFIHGLALGLLVPSPPGLIGRREVDFHSLYVAIKTGELLVEDANGPEALTVRYRIAEDD